jgi:outer membrane protein OmpA-like peptidoglycan-associated protein
MRAKRIVVVGLVVMMAAGCAPMRQDRNYRWALPVLGALAGAATGGILTHTQDSDAESGELAAATAGGAVGGGLLGGLGAYLLCEEAPAPPPPAVAAPPPPPPPAPKKGTKIAELAGPNFDFNKATLTPAGEKMVDGAARTLKDNPSMHVMVAGYTDSVGSDAYNQRLSERRAQAVARRLVDDGVSASRLDVKGFGKKNPVADNKTEEGRARNRRVEIVVD